MQTLTLSRSTPVALAACLFANSALPAQEVPAPRSPATNLPSIVVQASRTGRAASDMPTQVQVITGEEIRKAGYTDTVSALRSAAGVYFRQYGDNPGTSEISMRGFGANSHGRVLVLVDGERLNSADMNAPNWLRIPVAAIDRIEVLQGPQTALYGNYAVGGVVNIITKKDAEPGTTLSGHVGSDNSRGAHVRRTGDLEGTRYSLDLDAQASDGWRENTAFSAYDVRTAVSRQLSDRLTTRLSFFYNQSEYDLPGALTWKQFHDDPKGSSSLTEYESESWGLYSLTEGAVGEAGTLSFGAGYNRRLIGISSALSDANSQLDDFVLQPKYSFSHELLSLRNGVTVGLDWHNEWFDSSRGDIDRWSPALWAEDELFLTDKVSLKLTGRAEQNRSHFNHTAADATTIDSLSAVDAAVLYRPADTLKLFARGGTTYRFPFVDEYAVTDSSFAITGLNRDLDPEKGLFEEAGAEWAFAKNWQASLTVFHMDMEDEIAWVTDPVTWGGSNENIGRTSRNGFNAGLSWHDEAGYVLALHYTYVHARMENGVNEGNGIPLVPEQIVTLHSELPVGYGVTLLNTLRAVAEQDLSEDNRASPLAGYAVWDTGLRYEPCFAACLKGLSLTFMVDNVLDKIYATQGYGSVSTWGSYYGYYPSAGRTWKLGASYTF
ncbi:MAG: TonB-dependent receptor [Kiritimatiellia bacterium]|jgi:iron complex outermembrane receptor protein|nr:TonB-dependent receptor [Kiritimatiellia bacterium]